MGPRAMQSMKGLQHESQNSKARDDTAHEKRRINFKRYLRKVQVSTSSRSEQWPISSCRSFSPRIRRLRREANVREWTNTVVAATTNATLIATTELRSMEAFGASTHCKQTNRSEHIDLVTATRPADWDHEVERFKRSTVSTL